jgi:hypothetical protein
MFGTQSNTYGARHRPEINRLRLGTQVAWGIWHQAPRARRGCSGAKPSGSSRQARHGRAGVRGGEASRIQEERSRDRGGPVAKAKGGPRRRSAWIEGERNGDRGAPSESEGGCGDEALRVYLGSGQSPL